MKNILIVLTIPVILVFYYLGIIYFIPDFESRGQFGDMFGTVNALFSGLAFLGIIYTIHLQRNELSLQRKELELTRTELKRSAEAQEKSEQSLTRQAESLKMTAKLNGLNSLLQYELAKTDRDNTIGDNDGYPGGINSYRSPFDKQKVGEIVSDIESIVKSKQV